MRAPNDRAAGVRPTPATALETQDNDSDYAPHERADKHFRNAAAELAFTGRSLWRTDPHDGPQAFFVEYGGLVQRLGSLEAVQAILAQIGG
jgi:hypothetical protein